MTKTMDELCVNTIRTLAMDAVQQANSGHPGTPMALAPVVYQMWRVLCPSASAGNARSRRRETTADGSDAHDVHLDRRCDRGGGHLVRVRGSLGRDCRAMGSPQPCTSVGYPELKPHDLRHGVAMEVYEHHGDLEQVRELLGHKRIETTQVYAQIRPEQLKRG
jgi:hypothetical protein